MADLPTRADLFRVGRTAALGMPNVSIPAAEFDREGSNANLILALTAVMGEEVVRESALAMRDLFLGTAEDTGLDTLVFDRFSEVRKPAARALGTILYTRATAAAGAGIISTGAQIKSGGGVIVETTADANFGATALTVSTSARALLSGEDGNVPSTTDGTTWTYITQPFDATITISNPATFAGGAKQEEDRDFVRRIQNYLPTIRRGTQEAVEFGAASVPGVDTAQAIEVTTGGVPAANVELFVIDPLGESNALLLQLVRNNLLEYRALGIPVIVKGGTTVLQAISLTATFDTGVDTLAAVQLVKVTIADQVNELQVDQLLNTDLIIAAARSVPGLSKVTLISPAGDVTPSTGQAIRTNAALVKVNGA